MDGQLRGAVYFILTNIKRPFIIFWTVLVSFMVLTYGIDYIFSTGNDTAVNYDLSFSIYIFSAVLAYVTVKNCIPYLIKMGSTRMNIFVSTGVSFLILALVNAALSNTIYLIAEKIFRVTNDGIFVIETGEKSYSFSHLADSDLVLETTWYSRVVIDTSIAFFLLACFFIIGLIFYRFGYIGGFTILGITMATLVFGIAKGWILDFFIELFTDFSFIFFYQLLLSGVVIYLISYIVMRKITI